jgi:hypothetical protein
MKDKHLFDAKASSRVDLSTADAFMVIALVRPSKEDGAVGIVWVCKVRGVVARLKREEAGHETSQSRQQQTTVESKHDSFKAVVATR